MRLPILVAILTATVAIALAAHVSAQDTRAILPGQLGTPGSPSIPNGSNGQPPATMVVEPVAMMIAACDADNDGKTTRVELVLCVTKSFDAIDTGHKGSIGYIEYSDWALRWLGDRNGLPSPFTVDRDGDNRITVTELQAQFTTLFTRFDTDRDGTLTRAELLTIRATAGGERPADRSGKRRG
ncbi:MAG: EF-hand domain-containing protein [Sphingomonas sp.]